MTPKFQSLTNDQRAALSAPALIAFMETCADWQLTEAEELAVAGYPDIDRYKEWCLAAINDSPLSLSEWQLLRIGAVTGVEKTLKKLLPKTEDRITWLRSVSHGLICRGFAPIDILRIREDVHVVEFRDAIDSWIGSPLLRKYQLTRSTCR
jgi:hypothetical protein